MSSSVPELLDHIVNPKDLVLDGTKVGWYADRIAAWERGEKIAPVTMDVAWTRKCNFACDFCVEENQPISMADGTFKAIKDVREGDSVRSVAPDGRIVASTVRKAWQSNPSAPTLQLHLQSYKLVCTGNHPILTKKGWVRADELKTGQEVAVAYAAQQSYERPGNRGESSSHSQGERGLRALWGNDSEEMERRKEQRSLLDIARTEIALGAYEKAQSDAQAGCRSISLNDILGGAAQGSFRTHEENVARWGNYAESYRTRTEQIGEEIRAVAASIGIPIYGRWNALDSKHAKRNKKKPGLRLEVSNTENSISTERRLFPQEQGTSGEGTGRLPFDRMEGVDFLGDESRCQLASSDNPASGEQFCKWERIIAIEPGPDSAVYDLEVHPHHNFVASGIVVHNCYATMQASKGKEITREIALQFLSDAAEIGVKGVSLISDGESSIVPFYAESIEHGAKVGLQMGIGTNGFVLRRPILEKIIPHLSYFRYNFSGGDRQGYSRIMGVKPEWFDISVQNVKDAMEIKRAGNFPVTINMQFVCDPKEEKELIPWAKLVAEIKPDYGIIKHCADDVDHTLGTDYTKYAKLDETFNEVERIGKEAGVHIVIKRDRMKDEGKRDYSKCYGPPFITQMSGNGLIAPCGFLFNERYKAFHIGNICDTRFKDIFQSDRYWEVMRYLASDEFDPRKRCGPNCLQTQTNSFLFHYKEGRVKLPQGKPPPHLGFL